MPPSRSFLGPKTQKWPKVFPPAKLETSLFWAETFCVATRAKSGCVFFFVLKNMGFIRQEKQNTDDLVKNVEFWDPTNFVKPAKFYRNKISKKEKKYAPQFSRSSCRKIFSSIGQTVLEKKGENLFLAPKIGFWEICKIMKNHENFFFRFFTCNFFSYWNSVGCAS